MTFFDIFSSKVRKQEKIKILIDHREKNSLVPAFLKKAQFNIEFVQLPLGDYIANKTIIERKKVSDFKSSIISKRLFTQLLDLEKQKDTLLIIEGDYKDLLRGEGMHENAVRGMLLSLAREYQMQFILSENEEDTAKYIQCIAKKSPNKNRAMRISRTSLSDKERLQFILEGFPEIGPTSAQKLIATFHSLKNIVNASLEELEKCIGKKAHELYRLLNHED